MVLMENKQLTLRLHSHRPTSGPWSISIPSTNGGFVDLVVDESDLGLVASRCWRARWDEESRTFYVSSGRYSFHRVLMDAPPGMVVDHIDNNGLNNRRCNLRIVTNAQNVRRARQKRVPKTSRFTGVNYDKRLKKWRCQIKYIYKTIYLGMYESEIEAARFYDLVAKKLFGEFARPNFPKEGT